MLKTESEARETRKALAEKEKTERTKERISEGLFIGCDLGKSYDYTAIVGLERVRVTEFDKWREAPKTARIDLNNPMSALEPVFNVSREYHVRLIERVRLGTSYTDVVRHLLNVVERPTIKEKKPVIALDRSGIGAAVLDMLSEAGLKDVIAITATGGSTISEDGNLWNVPKTEMVALTKSCFGRKILKIAKGLKDSDAFTRELENFVLKRTESGNLQYEATTGHDDLVSALNLALWVASQREVIPMVAPIEIKKEWGDGFRIGRRAGRGSYSMTNTSKY
jgi:hypothetical protein